MIDLGYHLYGEFCQEAEMPRIVVVCEINNTRYGFLLERINQIFRISWDQLQAPSLPGGGEDSKAIAGVVSLDGGDIMMLNVEDIIEDLVGGGESIAAADAPVGVAVAAHRARTRVMVVDYSHTVREQLTRLLSEAGFAEVQIHRNGQEAYEALAAVRTGADASVDVLVTDIEMPLMDGLTLCRRLKEEVAGFPVVILSSMVTQQIADKCRQVGGGRLSFEAGFAAGGSEAGRGVRSRNGGGGVSRWNMRAAGSGLPGAGFFVV